MEFKVSDEQKELFSQIIDKNLNIGDLQEELKQGFEEIYANDTSQKFVEDELNKINNDIENLKDNNVISLQLLRLFSYVFSDDEEIQLSTEQSKELFASLPEDIIDDYEGIITKTQQNNRISLSDLLKITEINISSKEKIQLEPEMQTTLQKFINVNFGNGSIAETKKRMTENLSMGFIEYRDYLILIRYSKDELLSEKNKVFEELYLRGLISEEFFFKKLGETSFNQEFINDFNKQYNNRKQRSIKLSVNRVNSILQNLPENISEENKIRLEDLLEALLEALKDRNGSIEPEEVINEFNKISNDEWKKYLESGNGILFHQTEHSIEGDFFDRTISTSLIDKEHLIHYHSFPIGYKIKPELITVASSKDTYINNSMDDKYHQTVSSNIVVDLPQNVSKEMKEQKSYSEIDVTGFTFESVVVLSPSESNIALAQEMAEAQKVPIDVFDGKNFIPLEEYYLNQIMNDLRTNILNLKQYNRVISVLGLKDFNTDEEMIKNSIMKHLNIIDENKVNLSREEMLEIANKLRESGDISRSNQWIKF